MNIKNFQTLVQELAAAVQGGTQKYLVDLSVGSILRAVIEAFGGVAMWQQGQILALLQTTRAATSTGANLDSFMADYGVTRMNATYATALVTFSRFTATQQAIVPVGASVQTADGSQKYAVVAGGTNYRADLGGYVIPAGVESIDVPVQSLNAGTQANVLPNTITVLGTAISYVDTVNNAGEVTDGIDQESDTALRSRFIEYINSLEKATPLAVKAAINSVQQGMSYSLVENQDYAGNVQNGCFYVVIDDGSGSPTETLRTAVYAAIDKVRPITSTFGVFVPKVQTADVQMAISTAPGYDHLQVCSQVSAAIASYITTLGLGGDLTWTKLTQVAYNTSSGVTNVTQVLINGAQQDMPANNQIVIKPHTVQVV